MAEITVPLKAVWATWLEDRARRNGRSVVAEVQKIIAETWREDPYRLAQGGSQPVKAK
jgi:DNA-binding SARP family transcriptional activator